VEGVLKNGRVRDFELRSRTKNGDIMTVRTSAEPIELSGRTCLVIVLFDITARLAAEERLEASRQQLRALSGKLQSLREEERTHLAREIHDHLGQLLTAIDLDLHLIDKKIQGGVEGELRDLLRRKITSTRGLAAELITSVQKIASELRPAVLDRLGLEPAIESEAQAFENRTGVKCHVSLPESRVNAPPDQATAIFRIFQEILTNVARHAHATNVGVQIRHVDGNLLLAVQDDGVGMKDGALDDNDSLGLLGMRERAQLLGGKVTFGRNIPNGTVVTVSIPIEASSHST
jgi:signal transduction histidine kinase